MKIVVSQSELCLAIKELKKITLNRPTHSDFGDVKVSPLPGAVALHAVMNDASQQGCYITIPAVIENFLEPFYVNVYSFFDSVSSIEKTEPVQLTVGEDTVKVFGELSGIKSILAIKKTSEVRDGVELFNEKEEKTFKIQSEVLFSCINSTAFGASKDPCKQVLIGVNFSIEGNKLSVAATNGHILPMISFDDAVESEESEISFTFPAKLLKEIGKLIKKKGCSPMTSFSVSERYIEMEFSYGHVNFRYKVAQVPGTYPNYKQLFPGNFLFNSTTPVKQLLKGLEGAYKVSKVCNNVVKLSFDGGKVSLFADDGTKDGIKFHHIVDTNFDHSKEEEETFTIAFNSSYLIDGLKTMPFATTKVVMLANSPTTPAVLKPELLPNGVDYRYLVMPVQIRS